LVLISRILFSVNKEYKLFVKKLKYLARKLTSAIAFASVLDQVLPECHDFGKTDFLSIA